MKRFLTILLIAFFICGCASFYNYEGKGSRASDVYYVHNKKSTPSKSLPPASETLYNESAGQSQIAPVDLRGNYYAIVIGIDRYTQIPKLHTACSDAKAVAELLQDDYGFKVKLLIDATRADILRSLTALRNCDSNDCVLIYYAGHGWLDDRGDEGYWLPVDSDDQDRVNWLANATISTELRACDARHILVVADSCYSGKLTRGLEVLEKESNYYQKIAQRKARVAISSGGLEPVIDSGGEGKHSVFTSAFLDCLQKNTSVLDALSLFQNVRQKVSWNADQMPEYGVIHKTGHNGGDFIFLRKENK